MTPFSEHLRYHRERAGLSLNALAIRAGIYHQGIMRLESGKHQPRRETVDALAEALSLGPTEADQLRLAAGFSPNDLVGLVVAACEHLTANTTHRDVFDHAGLVRGMLGALIVALDDDGRDLDAICREITP